MATVRRATRRLCAPAHCDRGGPELRCGPIGSARRVVIWAAAIAAVVGLATWVGSSAALLRSYRHQAADALFPLSGADPRVVVVGVDAASIESVGRWPWDRTVQAELIDAIASAGPGVILLDVLYAPATPDDDRLAAALAAAQPVVVAATSEVIDRGGALPRGTRRVWPVSAIADTALVGIADVDPDPDDGVVRSLPLVIEVDGAFVPALSVAGLAAIDGAQLPPILRARGVQVGERVVATEGGGRLRIPFAEELLPPSWEAISAVDVLEGLVPARRLAGAAVLVGVTDDTAADRFPVPGAKGGGVPGVLIHAQALSAMLRGGSLDVAGDGTVTGWAVFLALLGAIAGLSRRSWTGLVAAPILVVGHVAMTTVAIELGLLVDPVYPALAALAGVGGGGVVRATTITRQRQRMVNILTQYVPTPVAKRLTGGPTRDLPEGTLTFLFTDVAGSTELWEREPDAMIEATKAHDILVERAVERAGGAVVRPRGEGDSRFAVFLAPADAVEAAASIQIGFARGGWPTSRPLEVRIGIHTGDATLYDGDYYGSPVNRCARIRSQATPGETLLSAAAATACRDALPSGWELLDRGEVELRGVEEPERVWALAPAAERVAGPR